MIGVVSWSGGSRGVVSYKDTELHLACSAAYGTSYLYRDGKLINRYYGNVISEFVCRVGEIVKVLGHNRNPQEKSKRNGFADIYGDKAYPCRKLCEAGLLRAKIVGIIGAYVYLSFLNDEYPNWGGARGEEFLASDIEKLPRKQKVDMLLETM